MDDPEPLERVARGVPASFAAIIRKLMAKKPDDRYQTCAELRADLARWTDPARVHAILGDEADAARAFHLPVAELDEEDLRLLGDDESTSHTGSSLSLRDLGDAEPAAAPMYKPSRPLRAVIIGAEDYRQRGGLPPRRGEAASENRWLFHFIAIAVVLGVLAILAITLIQ
jgi:serine/threonine-protein kinase